LENVTSTLSEWDFVIEGGGGGFVRDITDRLATGGAIEHRQHAAEALQHHFGRADAC
jgi:hypothetical protein